MNLQEAKKLENKLMEILKKYLKKNDTIVAGISGGPDSIFMMQILEKFQKVTPIKIIAAHVNHLIRKKSSDDEAFIKTIVKLSKNPKILLSVLKRDIPALSKKLKTGIEETGRKVRYDFFKKLAKKYKARFVITAHHADDNLETIIMNFARGAGAAGLAGMRETDSLNNKTHLLRPMISVSKKQILDYLKLHEIKFLHDASNDSLIYNRNFVRHKIIPQFKKLNPSIAETIAKNATNLREINEFLKNEAEKWIKKNKLNAKSFRRLPSPIQKAIIRQIYEMQTGSTENVENIHVDEILCLINQNVGNKEKKIGKLKFSLKQNKIKIAKIHQKAQY